MERKHVCSCPPSFLREAVEGETAGYDGPRSAKDFEGHRRDAWGYEESADPHPNGQASLGQKSLRPVPRERRAHNVLGRI